VIRKDVARLAVEILAGFSRWQVWRLLKTYELNRIGLKRHRCKLLGKKIMRI